MNMDELIKKLEELRDEIIRHDHLYYVMNQPEISDYQYDELMKELRRLENDNAELVTEYSPSQRIRTEPADGFIQVSHRRPMLSLSNAFDEEEFTAWHFRKTEMLDIGDFEMVCELKYDGLAVSLAFEDGVFTRGATRGNGMVGEDITSNLRTIRSLPLKVRREDVPRYFEVRGEVYCPKLKFDKFNQQRLSQGLPPYSNPRNTAAGSIRQHDPRVTAQRPLDLFIYGLGHSDPEVMDNQWDTLRWISELGFKVNPNNMRVKTVAQVRQYFNKWLESKNILDYDCDGVVVKINRFDLQRHLGSVGREPRWAVAYKFPATQSVTRVLDININVGRTGSINPYAVLEPVNVGGAIVKQATLHNEDYIISKGILIGDWVVIERAGEVIPQIVSVLTNKRTGQEIAFNMPKSCPSCHQNLKRFQGETVIYCVNSSCSAQLVRSLAHFVSKEAMDIDGMGGRTGEMLISEGLVSDVADLYALRREDLMKIDGMADKSISKLLASINDSKDRSLSRLLVALGITHVGTEMAGLLARQFGSIDVIIEASENDLSVLPSIGPKIANATVSHFENKHNQNILKKLKESGVNMFDERKSSALQPLKGMTFVMTGRLLAFSRLEIEAKIKQLGGSVSKNVRKKTDYLVIGADPGSKLLDAEQSDVKIIDEKEFLNLIDET